jgi:hypothetical protein
MSTLSSDFLGGKAAQAKPDVVRLSTLKQPEKGKALFAGSEEA